MIALKISMGLLILAVALFLATGVALLCGAYPAAIALLIITLMTVVISATVALIGMFTDG